MACLDETGHPVRARLGTTWAPTGRPPGLKRVGQRREVSRIVALVAPLDGPGDRARLFARHCRGRIHGEQVLVALRHFRRRIGRPLVVSWDRVNAHRARPVQAFVAAHPDDYQLEWLPPYAPDLNPEELCTGAVKRDLLNAAPSSVDALHRSARRSFRRLACRVHQLHRFFHHAGLSVT
ncbi:MAG: transposase [Chloroflexota bacterium]